MAKTRSRSSSDNPQRQQGAGTVDAQANSRFFTALPPEIRALIYARLFSSTRFLIYERLVGDCGVADHRKVRCAPNGLALLRACRRAYFEVGDSWVRHVLFSFESMTAMVDTLSELPADTISKVRHARIRGDFDCLHLPGARSITLCSLTPLLEFLPGLQLEELTVLGSNSASLNYQAIFELVRYGSGWKRLRYICCSSEALGYSSEDADRDVLLSQAEHSWRQPQPAHWQRELEERDGAASRPLVTVYRAKKPAVHGSILDPSMRDKFEQKPLAGTSGPPFVFPSDPDLTTGEEGEKELMVVVERGRGVDYQVKSGLPLIKIDIRRSLPEFTWKEAWELRTRRSGRRRGKALSAAEPASPHPAWRKPWVDDVYADVDEYAWIGST